MKVLRVKQGEIVAKRQDKVMEWYLIQKGAVVRQFAFAEIEMKRNSIIGILENEWFACDYVAREDTVLIVIPCKNAADLHQILSEHENFRPIFLRTAIEQRHQALFLYSSLQKKADLLHRVAEGFYSDYKNACSELLMDEQDFTRMENFEALNMQHRAENWEISNSNSLVKYYLKDYMQLMIRDDNLCVGAIMEAAAQMRRVTQGIGELVTYLLYNRDILYSDSGDDIFHLYFGLAVVLSGKDRDITVIRKQMLSIAEVMEKLGIYEQGQAAKCRELCEEHNFETDDQGRIRVSREDCAARIMEYAGYDDDTIRGYKDLLAQYRDLPDRMSSDNDARKIRKEIMMHFYEIYQRAFLRSTEDLMRPSPVILMFLNFGFMDVELLGEEYTNTLYNLVDSLGLFHSDHIYTIYDWLLAIYQGKKDPSRNEFDLDYNGYLQDLKRQGEINDSQLARLKEDPKAKVEFEIKNIFVSGHRLTSGRITTFCPVLTSDEFINTIEKMAVTAERIEGAINKIRCLDYSVLYREVMFSDPAHGINQEWLMHEVLPDVILMPDAGTRAVMWQETVGAKSNTPARFLFPMFSAADLDELMVETMGRYRWEICRRIQGVYWNDIRERSLTSEYCDYIQFYRKNTDLSVDAKDKIKTALARARNSYREVFVKDYQSWMKYESAGSFRLNKVARDIMVRYCPFAKDVRQNLMQNPQYQNVFRKLDAENQKKVQRLTAMYDKYEAAGGEITPELNENLKYYQM